MIVKFLYLIAILFPRSIQSVVDVEGGRAGDGERQVGEAGDCVHPRGPLGRSVRLDKCLSYSVISTLIGRVPTRLSSNWSRASEC